MGAAGKPNAVTPKRTKSRSVEASLPSVRSLRRGLQVLKVVSRASGIKAGEVSEQIGLARPTVYRLLETLEEEGYVVRSASDNRFRVTRQALSLSLGYDAVNSISQAAGPVLVELSQRFIWPFDLSVCDGAHMTIQESTHPRSPLAIDRGVIGRQLPILRTAAGRCYLAHCPATERQNLIRRIGRLKDSEDGFYLSPQALDRLITDTLERGYGARYQERYNSHTSSIAVPIFSGTTLIGSMAVIWISKALTLQEGVDQFLDTMRDAAQRITNWQDHKAKKA
jgi:IclR family mhp operon transcriptional activator